MIINDMAEATRKGKKATSYDVAKLAGVSQATVSLVLSDKGTAFGISSETSTKVREAAARLSYYPNSLVRSIRKGRTGIVGVYGRDRAWSQHNSYWIEALSSLHTSAADLDLELLIFSDHPNRPPEKGLERMLSGILDGMIVQPSEHNEVIESLARSRLPLVCIGDPFPGVPSVTIDNVGGVEASVAHLVARGRRSLVYLNFAEASFGAPSLRERTFLDTTGAAGVLSPLGAIRMAEGFEIVINRVVQAKADGIMAINDEWAYLALRACMQQGVRVPEDVAIVGFDGIPVPFAPKPVTTIHSPIGEMCRTAMERLQAIIEGKPVPDVTTLPVELVQGETS